MCVCGLADVRFGSILLKKAS